jgi:hypothetical protein
MDQDAACALVRLSKTIYKLMIKTDVQAAALNALARTHPSPDQVEINFRALVNDFHKATDAAPEGDEFHPYLTTEVELFLAALKEPKS